MPKTEGLLAPALFAVMLGGCSTDVSSFSIAELNPLKGSDPLRSADYNYFYKRDQTNTGIVTAADLVGPDGRCASDPAPTYSPAAPDACRLAGRADGPGADPRPGALPASFRAAARELTGAHHARGTFTTP